MGIDDLLDDVEESKKEEKKEEVEDKLGIDDVEDLEELDGRIGDVYELLMEMDKEIEDLKSENLIIKAALTKVLESEEFAQKKWNRFINDDS